MNLRGRSPIACHTRRRAASVPQISPSLSKNTTNKIKHYKQFHSLCLSFSEHQCEIRRSKQWWYSAAFMATTSYSGIGRYNYKLLPLTLCSITSCPCHSSPSKALVPARPRVVKLNFVFDGRRSLLRLGRDGGLARRRVITAVARVEPEQLGEENANQVLSI